MLLVWHRIGGKSRGSGHLVDWHVVHVFYSIRYFTVLNTVNLSGFVTLTFWHFVTPQERTHWLSVQRECDIFKLNLGSSS